VGRITQNELHESVNTEINKVSKIGDITQLHTTDKSSLVSAINEVEETLARELADYVQYRLSVANTITMGGMI